jgi:hypothetical protein
VQRYLYIGDVTAEIVGAPLRWTVAAVIVAVGLRDEAGRVGIFRLDANGMGPQADGDDRHIELRHRRGSDWSSAQLNVVAPRATWAGDRSAVARPANRPGARGGAFAS